MAFHIEGGPSKRSKAAPLPRPVQDFLGRQLRSAYGEALEKPAYLGDPALPRAFDELLYRLAAGERSRHLARERGLVAVRTALQDLLFAACLVRH
ncbi:MAG TPA: hypothetical protein VHK66_01450 [Microvirga sp.]|nr:hypothetical protein [Microvirga sp.]